MSQYFLDYIDHEGCRVRNIADEGFAHLREAQAEAAKIIDEFANAGTRSYVLGYIEIVDEAGAWVCSFHFPV